MEKEKIVEGAVEAVLDWLPRQPHLPQNIGKQLIKRFVTSSNCNTERAKQLIELNYNLRSHAPEIFDNRDPRQEAIQKIFDAIDYCPLPNLTDKKHKVFIYRLCDTNADKFDFADVLKVFFMVADIRMHTDLSDSEGEIPIFDMAGLTLRHLTKITLPLVKKYMVYSQEAHPVRIRQIHIVNTASLLDKCMALVRPFMKSEVAKMINFHATNSTTLFNHIPREILPEEYGGTLTVTMSSLKKEWRARVEDNVEFFLDETRWKMDESKRPEKSGCGNNLFGMQGSFRTLTID